MTYFIYTAVIIALIWVIKLMFTPSKRIQPKGDWENVILENATVFEKAFKNFKNSHDDNELNIIYFIKNIILNSKSYYNDEVIEFTNSLFDKLFQNDTNLKIKLSLKATFLYNNHNFEEAYQVYLKLLEIYKNEPIENTIELRKLNLEIGKIMLYHLNLDGVNYINQCGKYSITEDERQEWLLEANLVNLKINHKDKEALSKINELLTTYKIEKDIDKVCYIHKELAKVYVNVNHSYKATSNINSCNDYYSQLAFIDPNRYIYDYAVFLNGSLDYLIKSKSSLFISAFLDEFSEICIALLKTKLQKRSIAKASSNSLFNHATSYLKDSKRGDLKNLYATFIDELSLYNDDLEIQGFLSLIYHNLYAFERADNPKGSLVLGQKSYNFLKNNRINHNIFDYVHFEVNELVSFSSYYTNVEKDKEKSLFYVNEALKLIPLISEENIDSAITENNSISVIKDYWAKVENFS